MTIAPAGTPADMRSFDVTTPDGRTLACYEAGDPDGLLLVRHHGTPVSGWLRDSWAADAAAKGLRMVGFDRAGYGDSTRQPGRSVAAVADDVAALADSLGAERFVTWGESGGGPHTLACAALLGDRVIAAATLASVAPFDADGLDFLAGMGQDNLDEFGAALQGEDELRGYLAAARAEILAAQPEELKDALDSLLPDIDKRELSGELAEFMLAAMSHGLEPGVDGWLDDDFAFTIPWGFDVSSIQVPLLILQGREDLMVPFAHGEWLAGQLPDATTWLSDGDGHLSIAARLPEVHDWLLSHA